MTCRRSSFGGGGGASPISLNATPPPTTRTTSTTMASSAIRSRRTGARIVARCGELTPAMRNFIRARGLRTGVRNLILALVAIAAVCGCLSLVPARAQVPAATFSAYPVPGTLTAAAGTNISFRGGNAAALGAVTVTGSETGEHPGTLQDHSDGQGTSFVPAKPFAADEQVTVKTGANVLGATGGDFAFTIGNGTGRKNRLPEPPEVGNGAVQSYATRPDLMPPAFTVSMAKPGRAPGLVFLAPKGGHGQDGVMIINDKGQLVWFKPTLGRIPADFRVQT